MPCNTAQIGKIRVPINSYPASLLSIEDYHLTNTDFTTTLRYDEHCLYPFKTYVNINSKDDKV